MAPKSNRFADGERVLCFHGPLLYEAKCVKAEIVKDKVTRYFVHYSGWNKHWDEWVPDGRVLRYNDANLQKQNELFAAHKTKQVGLPRGLPRGRPKKKNDKEKDSPKPSRPSTPTTEKPEKEKPAKRGHSNVEKASTSSTPATPTPPADKSEKAPETDSQATPEPPKKKRARLDPTVESEDAYVAKIEVKIKVPDDLKLWLADDWDLITRQKHLIHLPAKKTVEQLLDEYTEFKTSKPNTNKDAVLEVASGICEYFNVMLGTQLLYKFERPQYGDMLCQHPDTPLSKIYGAMHLLRLFVKLGQMLAYTKMDEKGIHLLITYIQDFLRYFQKNVSSLLNINDYIVASPEYHRKAM